MHCTMDIESSKRSLQHVRHLVAVDSLLLNLTVAIVAVFSGLISNLLTRTSTAHLYLPVYVPCFIPVPSSYNTLVSTIPNDSESCLQEYCRERCRMLLQQLHDGRRMQITSMSVHGRSAQEFSATYRTVLYHTDREDAL